MLGLNANGNHIGRDAVITGAMMGILEFLNKLPEGELPTQLDVYMSIRLALIAMIVFYLTNKAIHKEVKK